MALASCLLRKSHILGVVMFLAGCAGPQVVPLQGWLANRPEWRVAQVNAGPWPVAVVEKPGVGRRVIYIEGDGHAYVRRDLPSMDPTPVDPEGLKMALADKSGGPVDYVARPCQWEAKGPWCGPDVWTRGRFTQAMTDAYVNVVAQLSHGEEVEVVGYSGGAWLALQMASRLPNVARVVTVAGNVDPAWVNAFHKVSEIEVAPYGPRLATVAQVHYVGDRDKVVPEEAVRQFVEREKPADVRVVVVPGMAHGGWAAAWPELQE
jgi:pimeloyl-ACP methyl ester carboxylesterase